MDIMDTLKSFLKEKRLELCPDKTRILVFRKNKERNEIWKWRDKIIQEVQIFKYLGFTFNRKDNYKNHIKDLSGKNRMQK